MNFLSVIFFIILFFYLLQWGVRLLLRWKINKIQREMAGPNGGKGFYKQYTWGNGGRRERPAREGEVKVETRTAPDKKVNDRIGDYVEFEEIAE